MSQSQTIAHQAFESICSWYEAKAEEISEMSVTESSFEEWLNWEAFLACKRSSVGFARVVPKPSYSKSGPTTAEGQKSKELGDLAVGNGPEEGNDWVFFEIALLHDGNRAAKWQRKIRKDVRKLQMLGWTEAKAVLIVVSVCRGQQNRKRERFFKAFDVWNLLTEYQRSFSLPEGGYVEIRAFDVLGVTLNQ